MIQSLRPLAIALLLAGCSADGGGVALQRVELSVPSRPAPFDLRPERSAEPAAVDPTPSECPTGFTCDLAAFDRAPRPTITELLVRKQAHQLHLVHDTTIVKSYRVALGAGGLGQKAYEGDKVTPIGSYRITGRYESRWHTYLALDYPSDVDKARHGQLLAAGEIPEGRGPGSAIAIHGRRADMPDGLHKLVDWTLGCVALDNDEIDEVASVVAIGTRVVIEP